MPACDVSFSLTATITKRSTLKFAFQAFADRTTHSLLLIAPAMTLCDQSE